MLWGRNSQGRFECEIMVLKRERTYCKQISMVIWYVDEGDVTLATTNYVVFLEPKLIICA